MSRIIDAFTQFFDDSGNPLEDGWLKFNESGTNNTDKDTFADVGEQIANTNPVQLSGAGRAPNIFGTGTYNVISFVDAAGSPGAQIQQFDPVGGDLSGSAFSDWSASTTYSIGAKVTGPDGNDYRSITNNNQNNNPTSSAANWEQLQLGRIWNTNATYSAFDSVYGSDGKLYVSLIGSNNANDPVGDDGAIWGPGSIGQFSAWSATRTYSKGEGSLGSDNFLYFSIADSNTNNNPVTDTASTNWRASDQVRSADAAGTVDAITATFIPAVGVLKNALMVRLRAAGANATTTPTFAPDGLTAKTIVKTGNQALAAGDIFGADHELILVYNSTNDNWELLNPASTAAVIAQVVTATTATSATTTTLIPYDNTIPQNTEGAELLTVAITPTKSGNKLIIEFQGMMGPSGNRLTVSLFQDSTAGALDATTGLNVTNGTTPYNLRHVMTAGTVSATTFKIRFGPSAGTGYALRTASGDFFGGVASATLTITEVEV